jgi:hypothetical protein
VAERVLGQFKRTQFIERIDLEDQTTTDYIESALTDSYPDSASETKKGLLRLAVSKSLSGARSLSPSLCGSLNVKLRLEPLGTAGLIFLVYFLQRQHFAISLTLQPC